MGNEIIVREEKVKTQSETGRKNKTKKEQRDTVSLGQDKQRILNEVRQQTSVTCGVTPLY